MADPTRYAVLDLSYNGAPIAGYTVSATYTDKADGALDDLSVCLEDRDGLWQGPWFPGRGDMLSARVICYHWRWKGDTRILDCGMFSITEVSLRGQPDMVEVKAVSAKVATDARVRRKTTAWEDFSLSAVARQIAGRAGLKLTFKGQDRTYDRIEQREEGDLPFLARLCRDVGNKMKIADDHIYIYKDMPPSSLIIARGDTWIKSYCLRAQTHDQYQTARVKYWHPKKKEYIESVVKAEPAPVVPGYDIPLDSYKTKYLKGQTVESAAEKYQKIFQQAAAPPGIGECIEINPRVDTVAEAEKIAAGTLARKNQAGFELDFTLVGEPGARASLGSAVTGFGVFDGHYLIDEAAHAVDGGGGYTTNLKLKRPG